MDERISWSPRIRPVLIKRLDESDAPGLQDDERHEEENCYKKALGEGMDDPGRGL